MNAQTPLLNHIYQKYRTFLEKTNLTDEAIQRTRQIINEMHLLAVVYLATSQNNRASIDQRVLTVEKQLDAHINGQGWFSYYISKSNEVVTLD